MDTLLAGVPKELDQQLTVNVDGGEYSWIVEHEFLRSLQGHNLSVHAGSIDSEYSIVFDFTVIELKVKYRKAGQGTGAKDRGIERSVSTVLAGKIYQGTTGELYYVGTIGRTAEDRIAIEDLPAVEHEEISVTHGTLPSGGFLKRFLEPAVVITATAIAVYLFFSVRS